MKCLFDMLLFFGISGRVRINLGMLFGIDYLMIVVLVEVVFNFDIIQLNDVWVWVIKNDDGQMYVEECKV